MRSILTVGFLVQVFVYNNSYLPFKQSIATIMPIKKSLFSIRNRGFLAYLLISCGHVRPQSVNSDARGTEVPFRAPRLPFL
ncbi:MAG: hypothetical protein ACKO96_18160, partial [Flammeovirgaceae bacterium]